MKTYSAKPSEVVRKWHVVDASSSTLGRISTSVATLLMGKHKPMYTPHIDCGDYVIVINSENLKTTGDKLRQKKYYRYSGFPGGLKEKSLADKKEANSNEVIYQAVRNMLPSNKLRPERLKRLKIYTTTEHPHNPQNPAVYEINEGAK